MNIPETVKIGYKDYKVSKESRVFDSDGKELLGQIQYSEELIQLNMDYDIGEQMKATFIHECIHGIDDLFGIGLSEEQVERLGNGLYMMIKDNPGMFEVKNETI